MLHRKDMIGIARLLKRLQKELCHSCYYQLEDKIVKWLNDNHPNFNEVKFYRVIGREHGGNPLPFDEGAKRVSA